MADKASRETDKILYDLENELNDMYDYTYDKIESDTSEYVRSMQSYDESLNQRQRQKYAERNGLKIIASIFVVYMLSVNSSAVKKINASMNNVTDTNYNYWREIFIKRTGIDINVTNVIIPYVIKKYGQRAYNRLQQEKYISRSILKEIKKGIKAGDNTKKIADRIQKVSNKSRNSAITTARTETTRIMNQSRMEAFRDAERMGIEFEKRWNHSGASKHPRDWHVDMDSEKVDVSERFSNGLMQPGEAGAPAEEVINCRCYISAEF